MCVAGRWRPESFSSSAFAPAFPARPASRRIYVRGLLFGKSRAELIEIGKQIVDEYGDRELEAVLGGVGITGVDGELKNLIFAADGPKPRIVLRDALNNVIEIVENEEFCLVYDQPLCPEGLTWGQLVAWWCEHHDSDPEEPVEAARRLYERLRRSLQSSPEKVLFQTYAVPGLRALVGRQLDSRVGVVVQINLRYEGWSLEAALAAITGDHAV